MICINSLNEPTKVTNSRASRKMPVVWRRRQGLASGITFTTYERPALAENKALILKDGSKGRFNLGKLLLSIAAAFSHDKHKAEYDSLSIAQTIEDKLSMINGDITPELIAHTTYETLKNFDEIAAIQYGARHQLVTSLRKRGRPSLSA